MRTPPVSLSVPAAGERPPTRRVRVGSSFALEVSVTAPGDVALEGLGLRQSADRLAPARFAVFAASPGRHAVEFFPVQGEKRIAGQLSFEEPVTVTPQQPGR